MFIRKQLFLASVVLCVASIGHTAVANVKNQKKTSATLTDTTVTPPRNQINGSYIYGGLLYIQPNSTNLKYATFVAGNQPYSQSWHYLSTNPDYHPTFELGFNYALASSLYSVAGAWTHLDSNDNSSKQASNNTDLSTVEFVGPPYEMSPPVFGIKSVNSNVNFAFDGIVLNAVKWVEYDSHLQAKFFGGLNILRLNQTITTTFGDYAGTPATPYSYPLPPDPLFSFKTQNTSEYLGAGPDLGMSIQYTLDSGFGFMGEFLGLMSVGTIKARDNFTSTSTRLTNIGIGTSTQEITAPTATQVVFGADGKFGVFYNYHGINIPNLTIELGYRMVTYLNAISTISPQTLVQPGTVVTTPEFATGTMAIVSTTSKSGPFTYNGPFLNIKIAMD